MAPEYAQRAGKVLEQILKDTPQGNEDEQFLQGLVTVVEGYNSTHKISEVHRETPEIQRDLIQETFDLLGNLREPTANESKQLEKKGFVFLRVEAKSLGQVYKEYSEYFDYVNSSEGLRAYTPPQDFVIAINPKELRINDSNNNSQDRQLAMIEEHSRKKLEPLVADAKEIMLPATGIAQADIKFQKAHGGHKLLLDFWARSLDATAGSSVADVGRDHAGYRLDVRDWHRDHGHHGVWAVPAVVFPRK